MFPEVSGVFEELSMLPDMISEDSMAYIERYVVLLYDRTSGDASVNVNDTRKTLCSRSQITRKYSTHEKLPRGLCPASSSPGACVK